MKKPFTSPGQLTAPGPFVRRPRVDPGPPPDPGDANTILDENDIPILDENDQPLQDEGA